MLDEETKARIRAEEEARVLEQQRLETEKARIEAEQQYRVQVAARLRGSRTTRYLLWGIGLMLGLAVVLGLMVMRKPAQLEALPSDGWGGIQTADLLERCKERVRSQLGDYGAEFPTLAEARSQVSVSNDGKRWDGWAVCPALAGRPRVDFTCLYTPQTDSVTLEIIKP